MALIDSFAPAICALPERPEYTRGELLTPQFRLEEEDGLTMYYAPVDFVNTSARVALIGITPGWTQMEIAYRVARAELVRGTPPEEACRRAKARASFAGRMRATLVRMLDQLGFAQLFGLSSSSQLFTSARHLVHTTSAIRYPVFEAGRNYTGGRPHPLRSPMLMRYAREVLAPELCRLSHAVFVPLGKSVEAVLTALEAEGHLPAGRCLVGFPHPSGANGHRVRQFAASEAGLRRQLEGLLR